MKSTHSTERTDQRKKCWQSEQPAQASELRNVSREKIYEKYSSKDPIGMHGIQFSLLVRLSYCSESVPIELGNALNCRSHCREQDLGMPTSSLACVHQWGFNISVSTSPLWAHITSVHTSHL